MHKFFGSILMVIGLLVLGYSYFFSAAHITSSAVLQLEDSDALYSVGAGIAKAQAPLLLYAAALALFGFGFYNYFFKGKTKNEEKN